MMPTRSVHPDNNIKVQCSVSPCHTVKKYGLWNNHLSFHNMVCVSWQRHMILIFHTNKYHICHIWYMYHNINNLGFSVQCGSQIKFCSSVFLYPVSSKTALSILHFDSQHGRGVNSSFHTFLWVSLVGEQYCHSWETSIQDKMSFTKNTAGLCLQGTVVCCCLLLDITWSHHFINIYNNKSGIPLHMIISVLNNEFRRDTSFKALKAVSLSALRDAVNGAGFTK